MDASNNGNLSAERSPLLATGATSTGSANPSPYQSTTLTATAAAAAAKILADTKDNRGILRNDEDDDSSLASSALHPHKTTAWQTYIHLLKGFVGVGCLSLPWAISILGFVGGFLAIFILSAWTSYNCWTVVKVKRYIERWHEHHDPDGETRSELSASTQLTYPDVGEWAYGGRFQKYVSVCICVQQLAICTVYFSFIGENIRAVCQLIPDQVPDLFQSHLGVMGVALPCVLSLSFFPHLRALTPVMALATISLFACFGLLAYLMGTAWSDRPPMDLIETKPQQFPLALCAILYSYEGICIILPLESSMEQPKQFKTVIWAAMASVALIMAVFGVFSVIAFGEVTNGSITAALLDAYNQHQQDDSNVGNHHRQQHHQPDQRLIYVMIANTVASLSVLFTYPLMLFPALELMGPVLTKWATQILHPSQLETNDEKDLRGFERMPSILEDERSTFDDGFETSSLHQKHQHEYGQESNLEDTDSVVPAIVSNMTTNIFPRMHMPGDSPLVRLVLVLMTFVFAVIVPNVQALVSLAGAVAGSSTALLIPPILELALLQHIETSGGDLTSDQASERPKRRRVVFGNYWGEELKCYLLLAVGMTFFVIGTYAAVADIIRIWISGATTR